MTTQLPSKERLEKIVSWRETYGDDHNVMLPAEEAEAMARALLAGMEQEPVAYSLIFRNMDGELSGRINTNTTFATLKEAQSYGKGGRYIEQPDGSCKWIADTSLDPVVVPLYAAPAVPAPVAVPDEITFEQACLEVKGLSPAEAFMKAWNCRAAMLNHSSDPAKLSTEMHMLVESLISAIEKEQDRLFEEDYLMDSKECIDVIREEIVRIEQRLLATAPHPGASHD